VKTSGTDQNWGGLKAAAGKGELIGGQERADTGLGKQRKNHKRVVLEISGGGGLKKEELAYQPANKGTKLSDFKKETPM